jgi:ribosomal-protein-alanine N-acetyltransferase
MKIQSVVIRPLELADGPDVQSYASDERVARTTTIPQPYPDDGGEQFVKKCLEAHGRGRLFPFAILAAGEMIGVLELKVVKGEDRTVQCDYGIASTHWGKGITTHAVGLALTYAFQELGMEVVNSGCLARNPASARVLEKNEFTEIGQFIYNSSKFKDEPARRFCLTKQKWLHRNPE